jgi:hypothetical protein
MAGKIRKFAGEVKFVDRRDGPDTWRVTVEASSIKVAGAYVLREFFRRATFKGRDPYRRVVVTLSRLED